MHMDSKYRAASFVYGFADSTLMMGQRILLCVLVCLGCDIYMPRARMESSKGFTLSSMVIRIVRNFYFILRGLRKWLAINFNDGIIPVPAVQPIRRVRAHRSTPRRDVASHDYLADMARLHSSVRPCYIGSDEPISLLRMIAGAPSSKLNLNHSDPLSMSSSMSDIMSSLVEAFTGCLVDPEVATEELDEDGTYHDEVELKSFNCSSPEEVDECGKCTVAHANASFVYGLADSSLMMGQRILLCVLVCLGCDIYMPRARMESSKGFTLSSMVIRIARNFYFILRGLRKWLAINFNDGIIPVPAVQPIRRVRAHRSTPRRDVAPHDYLADMARLHSSVRPCYIGSDEPISLLRMIAGAAPSKLNLNHSDPMFKSPSISAIMSSVVEALWKRLINTFYNGGVLDSASGPTPSAMPSLSAVEVDVLTGLSQYANDRTEAIRTNWRHLHEIIPELEAVSKKAREMVTTFESKQKLRHQCLTLCLYDVNPIKDMLPRINDLVQRESPSFLILRNTGAKTINIKCTDPRKKWFGYQHFAGDFAPDGRTRGIMLLTSQSEMELVSTDYNDRGRFVVFRIKNSGLLIIIFDGTTTSVFSGQEHIQFIEFVAETAGAYVGQGHRVIVAGAPGIYASNFDVCDEFQGSGTTVEERSVLERFRHNGLHDVYRVQQPFGRDLSLWYQEPRSSGIGCRHDAIFVDQAILERVIEIQYLAEYVGNASAPVFMAFRP